MADSWSELSPDEKLADNFKVWLSPPGIEFKNPEAGRAYGERVTRLKDAIQLKVPDRVPVYANSGFFAAYYANISPEQAMYDYAKLGAAWEKHALDFKADVYGSSAIAGPGKAYEILDYRLYLWPGHGTPADTSYQCIEGEYMKPEDYDALIQDPSDFFLRTYLPRIFGALGPFQRLNHPVNAVEMAFTGVYLVPFGLPEVRTAFEALLAAGQEAMRWRTAVAACDRAVMESGFPLLTGSSTLAPFDVLADTLRGTRGIMLDIYRRPDKLLEALDRLTPLMIRMGVAGPRRSRRPLVYIPLHKGADGFMSDAQYKTFYWPTLQKLILGLIEEGLVPFVFAEGGYGTRLEIIRDIPQGRTVWQFDYTDMARAKEVLGKMACITGNVPISLLSTGTPHEVKDYCRRLIETAGKDGGFILSSGAVIDQAKPENIRAMIESAGEYGAYR